ncbi:MAG: class II aldolase/adducin family protein [Rhodospirillaceae bacterium]
MSSNHELELRCALIETCQEISRTGLSFGTSGNASVRLDQNSLLITPSGMNYHTLKPQDIVALKFDGSYAGQSLPSSEWRIHRDILQARLDVNAIVHVHSPSATALACQNRSIPSFHYMVAIVGGNSIRCGAYATFGTQELSDATLIALEARQACLMANHGQVALGSDLRSAFKLAGEVENLAAMYLLSCQGQEPKLLSDDEMAVVVEKFKSYGQG